MAAAKVLKNVYLFKDLSEAELGTLARATEEKDLMAGQDIFVKGQTADSFYVVVQGTVEISTTGDSGDTRAIAKLATGDHFGEMPFFDHGVRTATAQTKETSQLLELKYAKLTQVLESSPEIARKVYKSCAHFLALRLRSTLGDLNAAREAKARHT